MRCEWVIAVAVMVAGCSQGGNSVVGPIRAPIQPREPRLQFVDAPREAQANQLLPEIEVALFDSMGQPALATDVQLALAPNRDGARLLGTLVARSIDGVATFSDVRIDRGGSYRLMATAAAFVPVISEFITVQTAPLHLILMVADGWGYKHIEATQAYTGQAPFYTSYASHPVSTYDVTTLAAHRGVGYDAGLTWSLFDHAHLFATDSAASATAMYAGEKTTNGRLATSISNGRLLVLAEMADLQGLGVGAVTSVPMPHATPGAWLAHNEFRGNYFAIADEMLWGDPNTTGDAAVDGRYGGGRGPSTMDAAVILAGGHPGWVGETYMRTAMRNKLAQESGQPGNWTYVERISGQSNGGARLLAAANNSATRRLCGLFGGSGGNIEFRRADGSGASPENPTLAEMTAAALTVLQRRPAGFAVMIEGGAVDFASHYNQLDNCIGEMIGFEAAVRVVVDWVDSPSNAATWDNTLLIVTGDHECGYLTAGYREFPNVAFTEVSTRTLALEKAYGSAGRRASWEDTNANNEIDVGETVYWAWHTGAHSNSLIPLYVRGVGASRFDTRASGTDPVRGQYIDDTSVFHVMRDVLLAPR